MKKALALSLLVLGLSALSLGCTSSSGFSLCRGGSFWPTSRTTADKVYYDNQCNPCNPCNPCDPVPDPCVGCVPLGVNYNPGPQG